jgi:SAM-dependent methyltransferase
VRLFRSFLTEQTDPEGFYTLIADDSIDLLRPYVDLEGALVADFGGGPGFYSEAFRRAGARTVLVDADIDEIRLHGRRAPGAVVGLAEKAPLADASVDLAFSSNLLEHVRDLGATADQIARVVRPGGHVVLSYTIWFGPWGGHETSPWHYFGGHRAARRYAAKHGNPPKNLFGTSMFAASVTDGLRWLERHPEFTVLDLRPRYLPRWSSPLLRLPVLRELLTWNLWIVVRKPAEVQRDTELAPDQR